MWQPVSRPRHPSQMPTSKPSFLRLHKCFHSLHPTCVGGTENILLTLVRNVLDYPTPAVRRFTQETAEPIRFSPAEPVA